MSIIRIVTTLTRHSLPCLLVPRHFSPPATTVCSPPRPCGPHHHHPASATAWPERVQESFVMGSRSLVPSCWPAASDLLGLVTVTAPPCCTTCIGGPVVVCWPAAKAPAAVHHHTPASAIQARRAQGRVIRYHLACTNRTPSSSFFFVCWRAWS